ncbi:MAG: hypothetical protein EOO06_02745 [Chitinophagaceae bacterium]|nr:MAG: hypothetical protein EOO06_02745 [Chitinophagaceae bacterium]
MLKKIVSHPFFIFPLLTCLVFWPLATCLFTLKNDALTYYYPVRTLISDAINNGELPLWTPYINLGYPLHADMQSGAWNPVIWIFSLLTKYSLAAFHYELLLYISFAGIGFYYLCKSFGYSKTVALTMSIAYQFSGFMIDSVQFFNCISAACYLPFVLLFFRNLVLHQRLKDSFLLALFLFLLFTGGYPSLFIITAYALLAYLVWHLFNNFKNRKLFRPVLLHLLLSGMLFGLLSLPAIISFTRHLTEISRGAGQSLAIALENSMNPSAMLSVIAPFSTTANDQFLTSSILMRNMYFGLLPLMFLLYAVGNGMLKKQKELLFFFVLAMIMLGLAWGEFFFLRQIAYYCLPLMDSFRHPALFRLFTIFFLLIVAGAGMQSWMQQQVGKKLQLNLITRWLFLVILIITLMTLIFAKGIPFEVFNAGTNKVAALNMLTFKDRLLLQLPVIGCLLFACWRLAKWKMAPHTLVLIVIADMFVISQYNMPVTVIGSKSYNEVVQIMNRNMQNFPLPDNRPIATNIEELSRPAYVASPLPFAKRIGRTDFFITPGNLKTQDSFYYSSLRETAFRQPVAYLANRDQFLTSRAGDSITVTGISANSMEIELQAAAPGMLVLQQNFYKGWHAGIDGKFIEIQRVNLSLMGLKVPAGSHRVTLHYRPSLIMGSFYFSNVVLLFILVAAALSSFVAGKPKKLQKENLSGEEEKARI